jgi:hypothetical protein
LLHPESSAGNRQTWPSVPGDGLDNMGWSGWERFGNLTTCYDNQTKQDYSEQETEAIKRDGHTVGAIT